MIDDFPLSTARYLQRLNASIANASAAGGWRAKPCLLGALLSMRPPPAAAAAAAVAAAARPAFTLRFAVGGACRLDHVWPVVSAVADEVLADAYARLKLCKCDW